MKRKTASIATLLAATLLAVCAHAWSAPPGLPMADPEEAGMSREHLGRIAPAVQAAIKEGKLPGCVVLIARNGKVVYHEAFGNRRLKPQTMPMEKDTVFDMASITKPVATATSIMLLVERGDLRINDEYGDHVEAFKQNGKEDVTVFEMLTHQAGFVPDSPIGEYANAAQIWPNLWKLGLTYEPRSKFVYSDVGFQMLGRLVQEKSQLDLNAFSRQNIFEPLGMTETGFLPPKALRDRAATTEKRKGSWMQGEVHDPRSYAMGGIAGHAGLFSTATDLARYAEMIHGEGSYQGVRVLSSQTVKTMCEPHVVAGKAQRGLGWDVRSGYSSNRGELMTDQAIGHGGFTGTAMWIDPGLHLSVIFLSNRVHPNGKGSVNNLAGRIGSIAVAAITEPMPHGEAESSALAQPNNTQPKTPNEAANVLPGIDVLVRDRFNQLKDQRVGLITNHTGLSRSGERTVDLLKAAKQVDLQALFSPEHGIRGVLDDKVGDDRDPETNLPIYSLYGESRKPSDESLAKIDTLVFDIQDIGTRFYTYISTMLNAMQAAAENEKRFVVLDRPNPLGGLVVDGCVLDEGKQSFVGCHPIAVQHGMTVGEIATMLKSELRLDLDLEIIKVENWRRDMLWDETGLTWVNPSPNMRCWNEALLYPGIGLLETTNISVGRGTDRPFEIVAAPYIKPQRFASKLNACNLPGVRFVPRYITPDASKFKNERCGAVDIVITDRSKVQAFRTGITMASVLRQEFGDSWKMDGFNRLLCDDAVFDSIRDARPVDRILDNIDTELREFRERQKQFLMYR